MSLHAMCPSSHRPRQQQLPSLSSVFLFSFFIYFFSFILLSTFFSAYLAEASLTHNSNYTFAHVSRILCVSVEYGASIRFAEPVRTNKKIMFKHKIHLPTNTQVRHRPLLPIVAVNVHFFRFFWNMNAVFTSTQTRSTHIHTHSVTHGPCLSLPLITHI